MTRLHEATIKTTSKMSITFKNGMNAFETKRYKELKHLSAGVYGIVFKALDAKTNEYVALKFTLDYEEIESEIRTMQIISNDVNNCHELFACIKDYFTLTHDNMSTIDNTKNTFVDEESAYVFTNFAQAMKKKSEKTTEWLENKAGFDWEDAIPISVMKTLEKYNNSEKKAADTLEFTLKIDEIAERIKSVHVLATPFIEGVTLDDFFIKEERTRENTAILVDALMDVTEALVVLHKYKLYHRDLHTNNVMIRSGKLNSKKGKIESRAVVIDYGLLCTLEEENGQTKCNFDRRDIGIFLPTKIDDKEFEMLDIYKFFGFFQMQAKVEKKGGTFLNALNKFGYGYLLEIIKNLADKDILEKKQAEFYEKTNVLAPSLAQAILKEMIDAQNKKRLV